MNKIYLFSLNEINLNYNNNNYIISPNKFVKLEDYLNENIEISSKIGICNNLLLQNLQESNLLKLKISNLNDFKLIEIISTNIDKINKLKTKKCEIDIFCDHVEICYKTKYYSYYFECSNDNYAIEDNNSVYIFNNNKLLKFDLNNCSFTYLNCKQFSKKGDTIEILCQTQFNNTYFLLYSFNLTKNNVYIKRYKKGEIEISSYNLPFIVFGLLKCDFYDAKSYFDNNLEFEKIKKYLNSFNNIIEIENKFYLLGSNSTEVKFTINNKIIVDID